MPVKSRWLFSVLAVAFGAAVSLPAQRAPRGADEPVAVDFFATGPDGPVFDLRASELTLKVDGRTRKVRALRYIELPLATPAALAEPATTELDAPFGSNIPDASGRWVVVIVDHESIRPGTERNALAALIRLVNNLGPRDRVAFVKMPNAGVEIDFTERHDQVADALRKFVASAPRESTTQERSCRTRLLLNTLADYIGGLAVLDGPKTIVLLSTGMLNPRRDAPMLGPPGPCEIRMIYFQEVALAASRARASMYVIQPDDVTMDPARQVFVDPTLSRFSQADEDRAGLESLAGVTGGEFMRIIEPDDNSLVRHLRASSGYYIATFDPEPGERNGAPHRVELVVARDKVRVRMPPQIYIPRPVTTQALQASPADMLRNGILYRALPLRTTAYVSGGAGGKVKVLSVLEPVEPDVKITEAMFGLIDSRDKLIAQWTADAEALSAQPIVTAGEALPGSYRLRVAAIDSNGRRGTAEYEVMARLTEAEPLSLSGLALGVSREGVFTPKLVFGSDQAAVPYFEIYGRPPSSDSVSVRLEVAATADGRALATAAARVMAPESDRRLAVGAISIAALAPGEYVVRAIVSVDGRPVGRITRTLRKSPSGA